MASAWGTSWGDSWGDSWGSFVPPPQDSWGDSWGCSWRAAWGHQGCPLPPVPIQQNGGGWFYPPDPGLYDPERYYNHKAIKKDDKDFLNILIMAIKGIDKL